MSPPCGCGCRNGLSSCVWTVWLLHLTAAAAFLGTCTASEMDHCKKVDLSLEPQLYPLPSSLAIRPVSGDWYINIMLRVPESVAAVCIRLESIESYLQVTLYGNCDHWIAVHSGYLPQASLPLSWSTFRVSVAGDAVLLGDEHTGPLILTGKDFSLPRSDLRLAVTEAHGAEAMVGCSLGCPVEHFPSAGHNVKQRVGVWDQESLFFYFLGGANFSMLQYELICTMERDKKYFHDVEIRLGQEVTAEDWNLVKLSKSQHVASVHLNGRMVEEIQLSTSCPWDMYAIWLVGEASFSFSCTPAGASEHGTQPNVPTDQQTSLIIVTATIIVVGNVIRKFVCLLRGNIFLYYIDLWPWLFREALKSTWKSTLLIVVATILYITYSKLSYELLRLDEVT